VTLIDSVVDIDVQFLRNTLHRRKNLVEFHQPNTKTNVIHKHYLQVDQHEMADFSLTSLHVTVDDRMTFIYIAKYKLGLT